MQIRPLPPAQAGRWLLEVIHLGRRNPRAIFGAALLLVGCLYLLVVIGGLLAGLAGQGQINTATLALTLATMVAVFLLVPVLVGGLMHVIRCAEAGQDVRARDIFQPFANGRAGKLAAFGGLQILLMAAGMLVTRQLAGEDYMAAYNAAINAVLQQQQEIPALPAPAHPLWLFFWQLAFNYFTTVLLLLGIPLVMLSGLSFAAALKAAARAAVRNLLPNFLAGMLFSLILMVTLVILSLFASLLLLLAGMLLQPLALLLGLILTLAIIASVLVLVCGVGFLIWRDTFGEAPAAAPAGQITL